MGDCGGFGVRSNVWPGGLVCLRGDLGEEALLEEEIVSGSMERGQVVLI